MPAAPRPASGPWSPASCSSVQRLQAPPCRRARTCARTSPPRLQPRPIRSKRRGASNTRVVRQPAAVAPSADGQGERERLGARRCGGGERGAEASQRRGGGAQLQCLSAGEAVARHDDPNTGGPAKHRFGDPGAEPCISRAIGAAAAQHDVVPADRVAEPLGDPVDQALQLGVLEGVPLAAAVADRVMVMLAARVGRLEAGGPVDVEPVHERQRGEHLERAVDAREAGRAAVRAAEPVVDLLGAQAAGLALEQAEDLLASAAGAVPGAGELAARMLAPARVLVGLDRHGASLARSAANENGLQ